MKICKLTLLCFLIFVCMLACACKPEEAPEVEPHVHQWGEWDVTVAATSVSEGCEKRSCACGESEQRAIPALCTLIFHSGTEVAVPSKTASLQELASLVLPVPNKEGHSFVGWYTEAACTTKFDPLVVTKSGIFELYAKYSVNNDTCDVTISVNLKNAATLTGGQLTQTVQKGSDDFVEVNIAPKLGYKYLWYEINGVKYADDVITLANVEADTEVVVYMDYATYELPIVNIDTDDVAIDSLQDYTDMSFSITNTGNDEYDCSDKTGGIRLRGNSTSSKPKKPYRIKFDKKLSLFGLEKAKSWVLLAEYLDPSALHNYTAFSLANSADGLIFTPSPHKVNVYLNGNFIGLYTLCEQVQENEGRIGIEVDITEDMVELEDFNFFLTMDFRMKDDPEAVLDTNCIYIEKYNKYFELKYPEKDQFVTEAQFERFVQELKAYMENIMDICAAADAEALREEININSLIDFFLIDQIMGETDHAQASFNMYYTSTSSNSDENGKLNFGPIWDYDWSLHTPWTHEPNESYDLGNITTMVYANIFYEAIVSNVELAEQMRERYHTVFVPALLECIDGLLPLAYSMEDSLALNEARWYADTPEITIKNIEFLCDWLKQRQKFLAELWAIE